MLLSPNRFVKDWVEKNQLEKINEAFKKATDSDKKLSIIIGDDNETANETEIKEKSSNVSPSYLFNSKSLFRINNINPKFNFDNFIEGTSNQLAKVAALQVSKSLGSTYNPLFIYGGVGLGKTHLMHAVGNMVLDQKPDAKIVYLHSEKFVADMVKSLQSNKMEEFKEHYRNVDLLLIDDIQFFAGKNRSQEEFFHTFNALFEEQQQIILTSDKYPKEIDGVEERLKSRFGWGLTVDIEPPDLETRVAILANKAKESNIKVPYEVCFFIAEKVKTNVRELEGALKKVIASATFAGIDIDITSTKAVLKDILAIHDRLVTIENVQKIVSQYYNVKISDILSKKRNRMLARPRQMAMALCKDLTSHSLPEIGERFGGRDHTTVIHACKKIKELVSSTKDFKEDYHNLSKMLVQ
jgi:chromosomal replication initiator protein